MLLKLTSAVGFFFFLNPKTIEQICHRANSLKNLPSLNRHRGQICVSGLLPLTEMILILFQKVLG